MESIFETKEEYLAFIKAWKATVNSEKKTALTIEHFILYRMFKGRDWKVVLSETSRKETIAKATNIAEKRDARYLSLWPFGGLVTPEMAIQARANMETI